MKSKNKIMKHKTRLSLIKLFVIIFTVVLLAIPMAAGMPKVDMQALVTVMGLDKTEDGIKCTVEIILPVEENGAKSQNVITSGEGKTLSTAFENIGISIGRKLELHHCAIIIVGKKMAEYGITDELEYLLSAGKVSPGIRLMMSDNKDADEFIQKLSKYNEKMDTDNLIKYLGHGAHNYSQQMVLFLSETYSKSQTSVMPCLKLGDKAENMAAVEGDQAIKGEGGQAEDSKSSGGSEGGGDSGKSGGGGESSGGQGGGGGGEDDKKPTIIQNAKKIAVFEKGKLKTVWEGRTTNGLAWIDSETKFGVILLENFKVKERPMKDLSCFLIKKKVKTRADFSGETPVLRINVNAQFQFEERNKLYETMGDMEGNISDVIIPVIIGELEKYISEDILTVLESSKRDNCDGLMLHDKFYRYKNKKYKQFIKDGKNLLSECAVEFKFDIKLN